jgi:hypothetical protein
MPCAVDIDAERIRVASPAAARQKPSFSLPELEKACEIASGSTVTFLSCIVAVLPQQCKKKKVPSALPQAKKSATIACRPSSQRQKTN